MNGEGVRHRLSPFLTVTDEQYDAVVAGLAAARPDLTLLRARFLDPGSWTVIPDDEGRPSKAELFVSRATRPQDGHVIVNLWMAPDIRDTDQPKPHSHPADFASTIVYVPGPTRLGYTERRYRRVNADVWSQEHSYGHGEVNDFPLDQFHEVIDVAPGTVALMRWGPIVQARRWGYLDPNTGTFTPTTPDPVFQKHLEALNPHRQPSC